MIGVTCKHVTMKIVYRYSGEEFVVLRQNTATEPAKLVAERLCGSIESAFKGVGPGPKSSTLTVSIGRVNVPEHTSQPDRVVLLAD